ncbi:MAG: F0F1 ATP synthase subunit alpha [Planctomycetota bacterium]|jgi:F-type H+-transporting ATPase subunit alpha
MKFQPDEITSILRDQIANYRREVDVADVGRVLEVGDGIAQIVGLSGAMAGELLALDVGNGQPDVMGQVFNLQDSSIGAVIFGECDTVKAGQSVRGTGKLLSVPVGEAMLGRVVDALGRPVDGLGDIAAETRCPVERQAPGIADRQPVTEPLYTGIRAIDSMTPVGRGQRELIIGDRKTGKTAIAVDAIINQADTGVLCVYVAVGQKESSVAAVVETLRTHGALDHTIIVSASSSDATPLQVIAPYTGCAMAEHFMSQGKATLVVYDDLTKQAAAYREISLLLRRPPGREAYPGDVFYLHSRLLERACKLSDALGGGSMTALPICQTQEGEVAAYIPTNLISITDGQIYLDSGLFFAGTRPAINVGISVSRVGYKAASKAMKQVAKSLRLDLAAFRELESFAQLGMELDPAAQRQLDRGQRMVRLLTQSQYVPESNVEQIVTLYAGVNGHFDDVPLAKIDDCQDKLMQTLRADYADFFEEFDEAGELTEALEKRLRFAIRQFKEDYLTKPLRDAAEQAESDGD